MLLLTGAKNSSGTAVDGTQQWAEARTQVSKNLARQLSLLPSHLTAAADSCQDLNPLPAFIHAAHTIWPNNTQHFA